MVVLPYAYLPVLTFKLQPGGKLLRNLTAFIFLRQLNLQAYLFFIVIGHKDGGKWIGHSLLTGKVVSRFATHTQSFKTVRQTYIKMLGLENK